MKVTAAHKFLSARTILARKDGWKTLLPKHCAELLLDLEANYGAKEAYVKLASDYGQKIAQVILDLAITNVRNPEMNDKLFNAMYKG